MYSSALITPIVLALAMPVLSAPIGASEKFIFGREPEPNPAAAPILADDRPPFATSIFAPFPFSAQLTGTAEPTPTTKAFLGVGPALPPTGSVLLPRGASDTPALSPTKKVFLRFGPAIVPTGRVQSTDASDAPTPTDATSIAVITPTSNPFLGFGTLDFFSAGHVVSTDASGIPVVTGIVLPRDATDAPVPSSTTRVFLGFGPALPPSSQNRRSDVEEHLFNRAPEPVQFPTIIGPGTARVSPLFPLETTTSSETPVSSPTGSATGPNAPVESTGTTNPLQLSTRTPFTIPKSTGSSKTPVPSFTGIPRLGPGIAIPPKRPIVDEFQEKAQ